MKHPHFSQLHKDDQDWQLLVARKFFAFKVSSEWENWYSLYHLVICDDDDDKNEIYVCITKTLCFEIYIFYAYAVLFYSSNIG